MANTPRFPTHTGQGSSETTRKAPDAASSLGQKAQDAASNVAQKAQDVAGNLGQKAQDVAANVADRTDDVISKAGEQMSNLAGTLRERAPREGMLGNAAGAVADRLEASGNYLREHGVSDMASDVTGLIRQNPIPACLVGFGVGFLLGMALRR